MSLYHYAFRFSSQEDLTCTWACAENDKTWSFSDVYYSSGRLKTNVQWFAGWRCKYTTYYDFILFCGGGIAATTCGEILVRCSFTIHRRCCTLSVIAMCDRLSRVNLAWMDSAPCSPSRPNPTWKDFAHGTAWSSNTCIFMGTVAWGKDSRKNVMNSPTASSVKKNNNIVVLVHINIWRSITNLRHELVSHQWNCGRRCYGILQTLRIL